MKSTGSADGQGESGGTELVTLPVLGAFLALGAWWLPRLPEGRRGAADLAIVLLAMIALFGASLFVARRGGRGADRLRRGRIARLFLSAPFLLAIGLLLRLPLVAAPPRLSDDLYRYVWDGRVAAAGINPYRYAPTDPALEPLRDDSWRRINHPALPTIYPPFAQRVFAAGAALPDPLIGMKALLFLFDLAIALLLLATVARPLAERWRLLVWWWHPLAAIEWGWSGHIDVVALLFLVLALVVALRPPHATQPADRIRSLGIGGLIAAATLVKFLALPALPFLAPRRWVPAAAGAAAVIVLAYVPYLAVGVSVFGSLGTYLAKWRANDLIFGWILRPGTLLDQDARLTEAKLYGALFAGTVALFLALSRSRPAAAVATLLGAIVIVSPTIHPWYLAWVIPFLAFDFSAPWLYATLVVLMAYPLGLADPIDGGSGWSRAPWLRVVAFVPFAFLALRKFRTLRFPLAAAEIA